MNFFNKYFKKFSFLSNLLIGLVTFVFISGILQPYPVFAALPLTSLDKCKTSVQCLKEASGVIGNGGTSISWKKVVGTGAVSGATAAVTKELTDHLRNKMKNSAAQGFCDANPGNNLCPDGTGSFPGDELGEEGQSRYYFRSVGTGLDEPRTKDREDDNYKTEHQLI